MSFISMLKSAVRFYHRVDKKKLFTVMRVIRIQYGFRGMLRAIRNKANGLPALYGMGEPKDANACAPVSGFSPEHMERMGNLILKEQQSEFTPEELKQQIENFTQKPLFSVVMPLYNAPVKWLEKAVESLQAQYYENWELCAVDDGSKDRRGIDLIQRMMEKDPRIRLTIMDKNGGISAASNVALDMARGEYIALMDQDDELPPDAFFWFAKEINEHPEADFIYSDECKVEGEGHNRVFSCFYLKPDWSPMLLVNHMYTGHLTVYRTELVKKVGGFRSQYDFSQDYDLALRMSDITKNIRHIERVLYYWRIIPTSAASGAKDFARVSNLAALQDWYKRQGLKPVMERWFFGNYGSLMMTENPLVSIIIPSDSYENLVQCIDGVLRRTSYKNIEIIPVTNSKTAAEIEKEFTYVDQLHICHYNKVYNFSDKCNVGAEAAQGTILIFLNDDVIPYERDWVERLIEVLQYPGVGGVSPLLLYGNKTIQYAGMITGTPGLIGTSFNGIMREMPIPNPFKHELIRDVSILSGACLAMPKDIFQKVGGFDAVNTPNGLSDLDLSLKIIEAGYRCVFNPRAVLTHIGNHSWEQKEKVDKADIYCLKRWGKYLTKDPYFTNSMKKMLYTDFTFRYEIHSPDNLVVPKKPGSRDILFITHELSLTGAPIVLKDVVRIVLENGDFPVVLSLLDGPLKQDYLDMGVTVIIDESIRLRHWMFEHFARNFDLIFVNTMSCYDVIYMLNDSLPPVLWWLHEGSYVLDEMRGAIPSTISDRISVYAISDYTIRVLKEGGVPYKIGKLTWGVEDIPQSKTANKKNDLITFVILGSIEHRKGQDIVLNAIRKLKPEVLHKAEFIFVGKPLDKALVNEIKKACSENIQYIDAMPREDVLKLYEEADCIIIPSRDEPMSLVAIEAAILATPFICSDHTGVAQFVKDGENGMVFQSGNTLELSMKITGAVENPHLLRFMGHRAREIYEHHFEFEAYREKLLHILQEIIKK
jgi:GT2 family glycosyltransferase